VAEIEKAHKYGIERLLLELLPVVDNLENALNNLSENVSESDKEGIDLTLKSFESALDKFGISPIYPISEDFDPINHEAVSVVKDEKHADNKIVEVMQKGWRLHERVIRPARVVVIKN
jgi:molecular chaperone GrpE